MPIDHTQYQEEPSDDINGVSRIRPEVLWIKRLVHADDVVASFCIDSSNVTEEPPFNLCYEY